MPPKRSGKSSVRNRSSKPTGNSRQDNGLLGTPPAPFKTAPDSLAPFFDALSPRHVYIAHVDGMPRTFKRKIFSVPVLLNVAVALLFVLRVWYIGPYYLLLLDTALGNANETTLVARDLPWSALAKVVLRRGFTFMLDLMLAVFVWPWPLEFSVGLGPHSSPLRWRWAVGFRDKEIYVRRSRAWYTAISSGGGGSGSGMSTPGKDYVRNLTVRQELLAYVSQATSPLLQQQKTGYLTMDANWDLDWDLMVWATELVDKKELALDAFRTLVLVHHNDFGWLCVDMQALGGPGGPGDAVASASETERREKVFAFRDALAALGKEEVFYRWIEIIQFEATRPGGLGDEAQQAKVAKQVRELFASNGVDFDSLWKDSVGAEQI